MYPKSNQMKKLGVTMTMCLLLSVLSCSVDERRNPGETENNSTNFELLGTWKLGKYFEGGEEIAINSCETNETISFHKDNTFDYIYYGDAEPGKPCTISVTGKGTWYYTAEQKMVLNYSIQEHEDIVPIHFKISENTLLMTTDEGDASYTESYTRLQ